MCDTTESLMRWKCYNNVRPLRPVLIALQLTAAPNPHIIVKQFEAERFTYLLFELFIKKIKDLL